MPAPKGPKKQASPQEESRAVVTISEYISPPTPEEWAAWRWFQARIRAELARKYPLPATEKEQSA
jgi:hypothetical protein